MRPASLCLLGFLFACGSSDGGTDAGPLIDGGPADDGGEPVQCAEAERVARFSLTSTPDQGDFYGAYDDRPAIQLIATLAEADGCRFVGPSPALCDPACSNGEICDVHGTCATFPTSLPGGTLRVRGTEPPLDLEPQPGNSYYTTEEIPDLLQPGAEVTIELTGDVAPALTLSTIGIPPLSPATTQLTATRHQPMTVAWSPVDQPVDAEVVLHMDNDHHGTAAYVECVAPASAGTLTVPSEILDLLIAAGESGIGTYIENAYLLLRRQSAAVVPTGCATFATEHNIGVLVETILAD